MMAAAAAARSPNATWVTISSLRRSTRSTSAPACGPSSRTGRKVNVPISPRSTLLPVSRSRNHDSATACVIVPDAENTWLKNQARYAGD